MRDQDTCPGWIPTAPFEVDTATRVERDSFGFQPQTLVEVSAGFGTPADLPADIDHTVPGNPARRRQCMERIANLAGLIAEPG